MKSNLGIVFLRLQNPLVDRKHSLCAGSPFCARNNAFPTAQGGKGADTAIVSGWLEDVMEGMVTWWNIQLICWKQDVLKNIEV